MKPLRMGFIMSTEVGLNTQYLNWRNGLTPDLGIDPEWIPIEWWKDGGKFERLAALPHQARSYLRTLQELRSGLARGPFDAMFVASVNAVGKIGRMPRNVPYFVTCDVTPKQLYEFGNLYNKKPRRPAVLESLRYTRTRELYQTALAIFPWSDWVSSSLINDYDVDPEKIFVAPPGVDTDRWNCPPRDGESAVTNMLFVGGDFYRKGGDLLIEWAARTPKRNWKLHLVTRDKVQPPNDRVVIYNNLSANTPALISLYEQAEVFVLPTRGDCYPLAALEAMAAGLPIVISQTGGTHEIVTEGKTGFLIPPGDLTAITDRLEYMLDTPEQRSAMGHAARADAVQRYDVAKNIRRTVNIMQTVLEDRAGRNFQDISS